MQRIVVVGPPGSGKTTVAKTISRRLAVPHVELDSLWWEPNWTEAGVERFSERARAVVDGEHWVVDGNYFDHGARDVIWPRADTVVWLDHGRWVTVPRVIRRTLLRGIRRTELWSGNKESLRLALSPHSIIWFAWKAHPKYNRRYEGVEHNPELSHLRVVRLKEPRDVRGWISRLPGP